MKEQIQTIDDSGKVVSEIMSIMQELSAMGANDYEIPALEQLVNRLQRKEILPQDAIKKARMIHDQKQDYH